MKYVDKVKIHVIESGCQYDVTMTAEQLSNLRHMSDSNSWVEN